MAEFLEINLLAESSKSSQKIQLLAPSPIVIIYDQELVPYYAVHGAVHGLINYIDTKAKCRHRKKLTCRGTLRQVFICLRPPPLLGFC